ncbi:unnamed protein product [Protopolystoma xenopodis]|uniref:Uncharacterized protein n=1 Tax=Protopolystoma xenopodis TaxID=117903 RepID=A0A3S5CN94_9PLAT|nr:unnamed protein product [Protopolystoma xenopodis]
MPRFEAAAASHLPSDSMADSRHRFAFSRSLSRRRLRARLNSAFSNRTDRNLVEAVHVFPVKSLTQTATDSALGASAVKPPSFLSGPMADSRDLVSCMTIRDESSVARRVCPSIAAFSTPYAGSSAALNQALSLQRDVLPTESSSCHFSHNRARIPGCTGSFRATCAAGSCFRIRRRRSDPTRSHSGIMRRNRDESSSFSGSRVELAPTLSNTSSICSEGVINHIFFDVGMSVILQHTQLHASTSQGLCIHS